MCSLKVSDKQGSAWIAFIVVGCNTAAWFFLTGGCNTGICCFSWSSTITSSLKSLFAVKILFDLEDRFLNRPPKEDPPPPVVLLLLLLPTLLLIRDEVSGDENPRKSRCDFNDFLRSMLIGNAVWGWWIGGNDDAGIAFDVADGGGGAHCFGKIVGGDDDAITRGYYKKLAWISKQSVAPTYVLGLLKSTEWKVPQNQVAVFANATESISLVIASPAIKRNTGYLYQTCTFSFFFFHTRLHYLVLTHDLCPGHLAMILFSRKDHRVTRSSSPPVYTSIHQFPVPTVTLCCTYQNITTIRAPIHAC